MEERDTRRELVRVARAAYELRLAPGTSGNLSARCDGTFLVSPGGTSLGYLRECDFVEAGVRDREFDAPASSEAAMHAAIYRVDPGIYAILHFHGPWTILAGLTTQDSRWVPAHVPPEFGAIAPRGYLPRLRHLSPGSEELAIETASALDESDALGVVLAGHGGVCVGKGLEETLFSAEAVEAAAHLDYHLRLTLPATRGGIERD